MMNIYQQLWVISCSTKA